MGHLKASMYRGLLCAWLASFCAAMVAPPAMAQTPQDREQAPQGSSARQDGNTPATSEEDLDEVTIFGKIDFFRPEDSTSAAKMAVPIFDLAQSVSVVSADMLETLKLRDVDEIAAFVAGLDNRNEVPGEFTGLTARGFEVDLFDGYKLNGISYYPTEPLDPIAFDRVEVLKGPTGVVFGRNSYGGAINYITKKPLRSDRTAFSATTGSDGYGRVEADFNVLVGESLRIRLPIAVEVEDSQISDEKLKVAAAPSVALDLSESTTVELLTFFQDGKETPHYGYGAFASEVSSIASGEELFSCFDIPVQCSVPPDHFREVTVQPGWSTFQSDLYQVSGTLTHRLQAGGRLQLNGTYFRTYSEGLQNYVYGVMATNGDAPLWGDRVAFDARGTSAELAWSHEFELFGQQHEMYLGADYRDFNRLREDTSDPYLGIYNIFDPFRGQPVTAPYASSAIPMPQWLVNGFTEDDRVNTGAGIQGLFHLTQRLSLLLGGRYERSELVRVRRPNGDPDVTGLDPYPNEVRDFTVSEFVPRAGLTWAAAPERLNVYATYAEGYVPQFGVTRAGGIANPETGGQVEVGLKLQLFDKRFLATLAGYEIVRDEVTVGDPTNLPGESFVVAGLTQENRGIELELIGEPLPGVNLVAEFSKIDAKFTKSISETVPAGQEVGGVPETSGGLFVTYEFTTGPLHDFAIGGGIRYIGEQFAPGELYVVPSSTSYSANASYSGLENFSFGVVVDNLLDDVVYQLAGNYDVFGLSLGRERSIRAFVRYDLE